MHEGPRDTAKKSHAEFSERLIASDLWADIVRKTLVVAVFAASGMAAALTSVAGVPLASIALVLEVFGSDYGPAAAIACAMCFTASRRFSLYLRPRAINDG